MARPIKATPVLSLDAYDEFISELEKDEGKKIKIEKKNISQTIEKRLENNGPKWKKCL
jgi:hypothetical protein